MEKIERGDIKRIRWLESDEKDCEDKDIAVEKPPPAKKIRIKKQDDTATTKVKGDTKQKPTARISC